MAASKIMAMIMRTRKNRHTSRTIDPALPAMLSTLVKLKSLKEFIKLSVIDCRGLIFTDGTIDRDQFVTIVIDAAL